MQPGSFSPEGTLLVAFVVSSQNIVTLPWVGRSADHAAEIAGGITCADCLAVYVKSWSICLLTPKFSVFIVKLYLTNKSFDLVILFQNKNFLEAANLSSL